MPEKIEVVADDNNRCGEGPVWDEAHQRLIWTDLENKLVYQLVPATGDKTVISRGLMVAGIGLNRGGEMLFAGADGLHLWRGQDEYRTLFAEHDGEKLFFNDMIVGPHGRVYAGTVYWSPQGKEKSGKLYLIEKSSTIRVVDDGIEMSNGLGFSPDDGTLYFTDSALRTIYAYDVSRESGDLSNRRVFVRVPDDEGVPDGMTVDCEGNVWSAQWYGSQVVCYDTEGSVKRRISLPVQQVSSVAFGGPVLTDLYITTAGESWSSDFAPPRYNFDAPNIGGPLYRVRLDVQGRLEHLSEFSWH